MLGTRTVSKSLRTLESGFRLSIILGGAMALNAGFSARDFLRELRFGRRQSRRTFAADNRHILRAWRKHFGSSTPKMTRSASIR